jgi:hypothetical protein
MVDVAENPEVLPESEAPAAPAVLVPPPVLLPRSPPRLTITVTCEFCGVMTVHQPLHSPWAYWLAKDAENELRAAVALLRCPHA